MARIVLVVEDDADMRALIAATLRTAGYDPISAVSAQDGLVLRENGDCHAALLDLRLHGAVGTTTLSARPGASGFDALGAISAKWPAFPVIVATASGEVREAQVQARGARGFLPKPFSADRLLAAVAEVLAPAGSERPPRVQA